MKPGNKAPRRLLNQHIISLTIFLLISSSSYYHNQHMTLLTTPIPSQIDSSSNPNPSFDYVSLLIYQILAKSVTVSYQLTPKFISVPYLWCLVHRFYFIYRLNSATWKHITPFCLNKVHVFTIHKIKYEKKNKESTKIFK